ncbi:alpha/beta fold hydrolase [Rhodobacteraceae bacterium CCMM004]|nr:alpha/beta fold hydrolase [Rhodobacteraceae bacterium CCMM004]
MRVVGCGSPPDPPSGAERAPGTRADPTTALVPLASSDRRTRTSVSKTHESRNDPIPFADDASATRPGANRMKALHHGLDRLNGWLVARRPQAPVASTRADLDDLARRAPGELHGAPHRASPIFTPADGARTGTDRFVFRSAAPSGDPNNDRVHGIRWRAGEDRSDTAVIMLHGGFATGFTAERLFAPPFLAAGIDVIALALPWHMERAASASAYSGQYLLSGDIPRLVRGFAQAAQDAAALADALREDGYRRVFAGGISLGGNIAAQVACLAELDAIYMVIPAVDPYVTIWQSPIGAGIVRAARTAGYPDATVGQAMRLITPHLLGPPRTQAARMLIVHGAHDLLCPPGPISTLAEEWGIGDVRCLAAGHRSFGLHILKVRRLLAEATRHCPPIGDLTS